MSVAITEALVGRVATALGGAPAAAYWTPVIYPWSVRNFEARPCAPRPLPPTDALRIYAHVPFCRYHCTFCTYAVRGGAKREEMERYVAGVGRELESVEPGTPLSRLTVGGGTPTALPPDLLDEFFAGIFRRVTVPERHAYKMEASPDSLSEEHLTVMQKYGIGRVSVGVESMDDAVLDRVKRRHSPQQALDAIRMVRSRGFAANADLIYGLPGQDEASFARDLEAVVAAGATRVCLYALRLNERTRVAKQLSADERLDLARTLRWRSFATRLARELGFRQTHPYTFKRVDADAAPARGAAARSATASLDEFSVGMSARSQLGSTVYRNHDRVGTYLERVERGESPVESVFEMTRRDRKTQMLAVSLADAKPLLRADYERAFGVPIERDFGALLEQLRRAELIAGDAEQLVLTELGKLVYDRVLLCFYSQRDLDYLGRGAAPSLAAAPL